MLCWLLLTDSVSAEGISEHQQVAFDTPSLSALVDIIGADKHGLVMLMGKGGVGKTTLAAAVAVELAHRGLPVHLTTSDPAAHLSETLNGSLDNLTVSRIDPHAEIEIYKKHVLDTKGATLDAQGRALLEEDLTFSLHGGNCRVSGVFPDYPRVRHEVCRDGHRPYWPQPDRCSMRQALITAKLPGSSPTKRCTSPHR